MRAHRGGEKRRKPLTYANVTATLALFFALSGGALLRKYQ